jgi:hypothetical protein
LARHGDISQCEKWIKWTMALRIPLRVTIFNITMTKFPLYRCAFPVKRAWVDNDKASHHF